MAGGTDWFSDSFRVEYDRQNAAIGRFNLAVFGKTGVGKSTLVNAIFGEQVAPTGIGEPVTRGSRLYVDRFNHLGIVDTQGLEVGRDDREILSELDKAMRQMRRMPLSEQIHVAWFCLRGMDRRFEEAEADFVQRLHEIGLPVVLVLTQVPVRHPADPDAVPEGDTAPDWQIHPDAVTLGEQIVARDLPLAGGRPYYTNAVADPFTGQPTHGLAEVLDATFRVAPDGVTGALVSAQEIDLERKAKEAAQHIGAAVSSAAVAAASPIPFSDAALLVPIQLGMMARIAQIYKITFDRAALLAIASTTVATSAGRATFTGLLKMVPGAGTVAGGAIGAGVASSYTYAMGQAWLTVCQRLAAGQLRSVGGVLDNDAVKIAFLEEFRSKLTIRRRDKQSA